eukprot:TRINITY_DN95758_c0_g1_i1.p1 TRINITY_DN95758_c0_g1~~TRINITY_DN95758_c0_g1_i1.p1  ORF type:complete len:326 (+),score=61.70 TRINITY_DN95758_c0_g1_i1:67-978(+)
MAPQKRDIRRLTSGKLEGQGFGICTYSIYEALSGLDETQRNEAPYLFVWLHGADNGNIDAEILEKIQRRLQRRTIFMVPMSPKPSKKGLQFSWGVAYTKEQNKNSMGFIFGSLHEEFLSVLTGRIGDLSLKIGAERVIVAGFSMGAFGAYQLGGFAPELFDAVIAAAGYGLGTLEPSDRGYHAPQPRSSEIFEKFLTDFVSRLAYIPIVRAFHSRSDTICSFDDTSAIVEAIKKDHQGGVVELTEVPSNFPDSEQGRRKKPKHGHNYFNHVFVSDASEELLWEPLREAFASERYRRETEVPST